jgi:hypothetical protein
MLRCKVTSFKRVCHGTSGLRLLSTFLTAYLTPPLLTLPFNGYFALTKRDLSSNQYWFVDAAQIFCAARLPKLPALFLSLTLLAALDGTFLA